MAAREGYEGQGRGLKEVEGLLQMEVTLGPQIRRMYQKETWTETTPTQRAAYPGGRQIVREAYRLKGVQLSTSEFFLASITDSTLKQYEVGWKLWWDFCSSGESDPFDGSVLKVLEFLEAEFRKGGSYGSLNNFRSALSLIFSPDLANDFRVRRFFKGVSKLRPVLPKYDSVWNPTTVLDYLRALGGNETLSLELITMKLATLMALVTSHRVQTLALIEIEDVMVTLEGIEIKIPARIKTSGRRASIQPALFLPFFRENPEICAASTLLSYIEKTKDFRSDNMSKLFLTFKKPIKTANSQSISRWIKTVLSRSGINTSLFSAHSTRHAATSAAWRKGVSLDTIRRTAGWAKDSSTFAKFYNRPLRDRGSFAKSIIED